MVIKRLAEVKTGSDASSISSGAELMRGRSDLESDCIGREGRHPNAGIGPKPMPWASGDSKALVARDNLLTGLRPPSGRSDNELNRAGLQAVGLASFRAERLVFAGIDLVVDAGEALLLVGPNGSGKSTLMRLLAGLKQPDAGTVFWDGRSVTDDPGAHARRVAYVGHLDGVKPGLSTRGEPGLRREGRRRRH